MDNNRINYIDYTKGYGILLIVLAHVSAYFNACHFLAGYVASYHVSIFFIISGVLQSYRANRSESWSVFLRKRYHSLILPYIWFSLFNSALKLSVLFISHQLSREVVYSEMIELFITGNGTVWFLLTLFGVEVFYRIVVGFCNELCVVVLAILCISYSFFIGETSNPVAIVLLRILAAFFLFVLGIIGGKYVLRRYALSIYLGFALLLGGIICYCMLGSEYSFFSALFKNWVGSLLTILLNSFGCIIIFKNINREIAPWLYLGKNSLIIMLIHPTVLLFYTYPAQGSFNLLPVITQWMVALSVFVTIVLLEVPFIQLINKKMPFLIGKK
ncbi:acyltransferase family protein [Parabacteroides sp.]